MMMTKETFKNELINLINIIDLKDLEPNDKASYVIFDIDENYCIKTFDRDNISNYYKTKDEFYLNNFLNPILDYFENVILNEIKVRNKTIKTKVEYNYLSDIDNIFNAIKKINKFCNLKLSINDVFFLKDYEKTDKYEISIKNKNLIIKLM